LRALVVATPLATIALIVLGLQIAPRGWVTENYVALACVEFPTCLEPGIRPLILCVGCICCANWAMPADGEPLTHATASPRW
jgi:heme A synthase